MDQKYMKEAFKLGERGRGKTNPNPLVGAVIVKNGSIVGKGFHAQAGKPHAEINALESAGDKAKGATLYTSLEPCCSYGKTPPCTEAIIASGISQVIVGLIDPNPSVSGKGISILKKAGIKVETGFLKEEISVQNEVYRRYITTGEPFVLMKVAMSLDGKISSKNGQKWITGSKAREWVHQLRAEYDAIAVGIGTVLADDPLLTARFGGKEAKNPLRIVIDSRGRLPLDSKIVQSAGEVPTTLATTPKISRSKIEAFNRKKVEVLVLPAKEGRVDLKELLKELGKRGITSILVEGGAGLNGSFLKDNLVDKFLLFVAPKLLGKDSLSLVGDERLPATNLRIAQFKKAGEDLVIIAYPKAAGRSPRITSFRKQVKTTG